MLFQCFFIEFSFTCWTLDQASSSTATHRRLFCWIFRRLLRLIIWCQLVMEVEFRRHTSGTSLTNRTVHNCRFLWAKRIICWHWIDVLLRWYLRSRLWHIVSRWQSLSTSSHAIVWILLFLWWVWWVIWTEWSVITWIKTLLLLRSKDVVMILLIPIVNNPSTTLWIILYLIWFRWTSMAFWFKCLYFSLISLISLWCWPHRQSVWSFYWIIWILTSITLVVNGFDVWFKHFSVITTLTLTIFNALRLRLRIHIWLVGLVDSRRPWYMIKLSVTVWNRISIYLIVCPIAMHFNSITSIILLVRVMLNGLSLLHSFSWITDSLL